MQGCRGGLSVVPLDRKHDSVQGGAGTCTSCPYKEPSTGASTPAVPNDINDVPVETCCAAEKRSPWGLQALAKAATQVHGKRSLCPGLHLSPVI